MKAISVKQPWASMIARGMKGIETRSHKAPWSSHRGWLAIHASQAVDVEWEQIAWGQAALECGRELVSSGVLPLGAIIAVAFHVRTRQLDNLDTHLAMCGCEGLWGLDLVSPLALPEPILCKGRLGLWELDLETELELTGQLYEEYGICLG